MIRIHSVPPPGPIPRLAPCGPSALSTATAARGDETAPSMGPWRPNR